jgi:hypothetical protein
MHLWTEALRKLAELAVTDVTQSGLDCTGKPASAPGQSEKS